MISPTEYLGERSGSAGLPDDDDGTEGACCLLEVAGGTVLEGLAGDTSELMPLRILSFVTLGFTSKL
jgi:hypothetical protein